MEAVDGKISDELQNVIISDMRPTWMSVQLKLGLAVLCGGTLSLFFCGQFGFGLSPWAHMLGHSIHHQTHALLCAGICGFVFAVFPSFLLRLICSPMQFRIILRKRGLSLLSWYGCVAGLLSYHGDHGKAPWELAAWLLVALLTSYALAAGLQRLTWSLPYRLGRTRSL